VGVCSPCACVFAFCVLFVCSPCLCVLRCACSVCFAFVCVCVWVGAFVVCVCVSVCVGVCLCVLCVCVCLCVLCCVCVCYVSVWLCAVFVRFSVGFCQFPTEISHLLVPICSCLVGDASLGSLLVSHLLP
jgi:hypothetical protein